MNQLDQVRKAAVKAIENAQDKIIAAGRHLWKIPEPGYREFNTSAFIVNELIKLGLEVKTNLAITGFRADIDTGKPGPTLAILGELDSLIIPTHPAADPATGAVHACGHNVGGAGLIGSAIALLAVKNELCGKIALIGTPAEEGIEMSYRKSLIDSGRIRAIAGKSQLIIEGVFDDVDIVFMNHLGKSYGFWDHNGAINKRLTFRGKSCHAARPQGGKNALNAATLAMNAIALLRESLGYNDKIRIHGVITHGGDAVNVIPDRIDMDYMLRMPHLEEMKKLNDRFDNVVIHAAQAAECEVSIDTLSGYMPLYDDPALGKIMQQVVKYLDPAAEFEFNPEFLTSSTDMGDIATVIPALHGYVPGRSGTGHGVDYAIEDEYSAYVKNAQVAALMAVELLSGNGDTGKKIAAGKAALMPIKEYIETVQKINRTVKSDE
ncbi:MAG: amidohydrolase [Lentisphaerae bacterium]|nr:amidohydrolase [Lentisphaerota bacterium]